MKTGIKTLVALLAAGSALAALGGFAWRHPFWLTDLAPGTAFVIGLFAVLVCHLFCEFWRIRDPGRWFLHAGKQAESGAKFGLRIRRTDQERFFELTPLALTLLYFTCFLCLGILTINNRGLHLGRDFPAAFNEDEDQYCPEGEKALEAAPAAPGCELVLRAYKLGYTKKLGDCDPGLQRDGDEPKVCEKRRRDEPWLHFAYRQVKGFYDRRLAPGSGRSMQERLAAFEAQMNNAPLLAFEKMKSLTDLPRASHHIWTNLPHPRGPWRGTLEDLISRGSCLDRFGPARPGIRSQGSPAELLEHDFGQLMFNTAHAGSAGYCPEYTIHWDSDPDTCRRLATRPDQVIEAAGISGELQQVLLRINAKTQMTALQQKIGATSADKDPGLITRQETERFISFQCLHVGEGEETGDEALSFNWSGRSFQAHQISITPGRKDQGYFAPLAGLLSPGFQYAPLDSNASVLAADVQTTTLAMLDERDYMLTKLEMLKEADVFLGHDWIRSQPDLLEVYPWQHHLGNYVDKFRTRYKQERGRL